jgi:NAD(P)-dependent dehydrogenase (short-subunit alcohol dehydrogenase family)
MARDMTNLFSLAGRTALVTGAAGHLGRSISAGLANAGAHVVLNGRRREPLEELASEIAKQGGQATVASFDITDADAIEAALRDLEKLDIVVNNAYGGVTGSVDTATVPDFLDAYRVSVAAAHELTRVARPKLREAAKSNPGGASVINIASMYGLVSPDPSIYGDSGQNNPPHYGPAKAALIQLTRYLACHLAAEGIRVNCVSPGPFPRPAVAEQNPALHAKLQEKTPMRRIGNPDELIGPVVFLASDASSYVTGANLSVDGGWTAW